MLFGSEFRALLGLDPDRTWSQYRPHKEATLSMMDPWLKGS